MKLNKIVVGYYAILFLAFGLLGLSNPKFVSELVHYEFKNEIGNLDFLAMYGGLFIGVGVFLIYCLRENLKSGLVCILFTMGFMFVTRLYGYFSVGSADLVQYIYLGGELFSVVVILALLYFGKHEQKIYNEKSIT